MGIIPSALIVSTCPRWTPLQPIAKRERHLQGNGQLGATRLRDQVAQFPPGPPDQVRLFLPEANGGMRPLVPDPPGPEAPLAIGLVDSADRPLQRVPARERLDQLLANFFLRLAVRSKDIL